jgi:hypothetical protein
MLKKQSLEKKWLCKTKLVLCVKWSIWFSCCWKKITIQKIVILSSLCVLFTSFVRMCTLQWNCSYNSLEFNPIQIYKSKYNCQIVIYSQTTVKTRPIGCPMNYQPEVSKSDPITHWEQSKRAWSWSGVCTSERAASQPGGKIWSYHNIIISCKIILWVHIVQIVSYLIFIYFKITLCKSPRNYHSLALPPYHCSTGFMTAVQDWFLT